MIEYDYYSLDVNNSHVIFFNGKKKKIVKLDEIISTFAEL